MHYGTKHGWVHKIPCPSQSQSSALLLRIHIFQPNLSTQSSFHTCGFKFTVKLWPIPLPYLVVSYIFPQKIRFQKVTVSLLPFRCFNDIFMPKICQDCCHAQNSLVSSHFGTLLSHCGTTRCHYGMIDIIYPRIKIK